ncbi:winged helix-turn-helix domain-containing protein, partial [Mycobacterium kiyosense]|uniref:winged helix-turn-helix domain-containing protein n=1 Tax=Mycobacterium kiyosense TaxID=2871094 RepID=UPI00222FACE4
ENHGRVLRVFLDLGAQALDVHVHPADTRLVNVHVQRLRAKVEKDPENPTVVLTVRGVGYKAGPP